MTTTKRSSRNKTSTGIRRSVRVQALLFVAACVVVALSDLLVRAQLRNDVVDIAYYSRQLHKDLTDQHNIRGKLLSRLSQLQTMDYVRAKLVEQGMHLTQPEIERIVWLKMPQVPDELLEQVLPPMPEPPATPLNSSLLASHTPVQH
jgi:hypothetical protein